MNGLLKGNCRRFSTIAGWMYLSSLVLLVLALRIGGDAWWPATMLLFGPRWLVTLPLLLLLPLMMISGPKGWLPVIVSVPLLYFGWLGGEFAGTRSGKGVEQTLRVLSCNLQSGMFDKGAFSSLVAETVPDIVLLQECPSSKELTGFDGWYTLQENGLAIFARYPLVKVSELQSMHPGHAWPRTSLQASMVCMPERVLTVVNLHLPSPRYGLSHILDRHTVINPGKAQLLREETEHRRRSAARAKEIVANLPEPLILAGDFNLPVESVIYRTSWGDYTNAFSARGTGFGWTQFVILQGILTGVRIDHILTSRQLIPRVCEVGPHVGSDHRPLIADLAVH